MQQQQLNLVTDNDNLQHQTSVSVFGQENKTQQHGIETWNSVKDVVSNDDTNSCHVNDNDEMVENVHTLERNFQPPPPPLPPSPLTSIEQGKPPPPPPLLPDGWNNSNDEEDLGLQQCDSGSFQNNAILNLVSGDDNSQNQTSASLFGQEKKT